jgi:hypothetical protein
MWRERPIQRGSSARMVRFLATSTETIEEVSAVGRCYRAALITPAAWGIPR